MKSKQVTIKDIAKALNISPSTVSRALKDHPDISAETKKLVNDLSEKLNYEPNPIALSLRSQKTNTIGVIIPEIVHFFFSTVISGIEEVAYDAGYSVMFCQSNESYEKEVIDTKALLYHRVDGLLVSYSRETKNFDHFKQVQSRNVPLVFFDRTPKDIEAPKIIINDEQAGNSATLHLIDQGCKKIAHLAGPLALQISQKRLDGYKKALQAHKIEINDSYIIDCGHGNKEEGYASMKELLALKEIPDGVFANNDIAAYGAMIAIKEAGLHIPDDIAVVGFSNWQFSSLIEPQLSSIAQPGLEMGRAAARILIEQMNASDDEFSNITKTLPTDLIIRASSLKKRKKS